MSSNYVRQSPRKSQSSREDRSENGGAYQDPIQDGQDYVPQENQSLDSHPTVASGGDGQGSTSQGPWNAGNSGENGGNVDSGPVRTPPPAVQQPPRLRDMSRMPSSNIRTSPERGQISRPPANSNPTASASYNGTQAAQPPRRPSAGPQQPTERQSQRQTQRSKRSVPKPSPGRSYRANAQCGQNLQRPAHPQLQPSIIQQSRDRPPPHAPPHWSLSGNHGGGSSVIPSYIDPEYFELHPKRGQSAQKPIFSLAKPLPRVVRNGMRRHHEGNLGGQELQSQEPAEPMGKRAVPQVDMIPGQRVEESEQRTEENEPPADRMRPQTSQERKIEKIRSESRRGRGEIPQQGRDGRQTQQARDEEQERQGVNYFGSPREEKANPFDFGLSAASSPGQGPGGDGNMNGRQMSRVPERGSSETLLTDPRQAASKQDDYDADLERSDKSIVSWDDADDDDMPVDEENIDVGHRYHPYNRWARIRENFREPFAEFLATGILVLIGISVNLSVITSQSQAGTYQSKDWGWGFATMLGIYIAGGISGAHLNPCISVMLCIFRGFPARKMYQYICAQLIGCFVASFIAYGLYKDLIYIYEQQQDGGSLLLQGSGMAFVNVPTQGVSPVAAFFNEVVAAALLACAILALGDDDNAPPGAGMHALIVGFVVTVLTMAFGYPTGATLNPCRDWGPRFAIAAIKFHGGVFSDFHWWFLWGTMAGPMVGIVVGALAYDGLVFTGPESPVNYTHRRKEKLVGRTKEKVGGRIRRVGEGVGMCGRGIRRCVGRVTPEGERDGGEKRDVRDMV